MNQMELKHSWTFSRENPVIRFYLWAWEADLSKVTFCSLFWGYVFAIPNLIVRLLWKLIYPLRWVFARTGRIAKEMDERSKAEKQKKALEPKPDRPASISLFFSKPLPRLLGKGVLVILGLAVLAVVVWALYQTPIVATAVAEWFVETDAWSITLLVVFSVAVWIAGVWLTHALGPRLRARKRRKHAAGEPTLGDVLAVGAKSVKTNTCPRIEIKDEA